MIRTISYGITLVKELEELEQREVEEAVNTIAQAATYLPVDLVPTKPLLNPS
jgi:hypothetical protein